MLWTFNGGINQPQMRLVRHFDYDVSRHMGTDTGSDMDISPHISRQIEIFAKEAICRIWTYDTGHIVTYRANITISDKIYYQFHLTINLNEKETY